MVIFDTLELKGSQTNDTISYGNKQLTHDDLLLLGDGNKVAINCIFDLVGIRLAKLEEFENLFNTYLGQMIHLTQSGFDFFGFVSNYTAKEIEHYENCIDRLAKWSLTIEFTAFDIVVIKDVEKHRGLLR